MKDSQGKRVRNTVKSTVLISTVYKSRVLFQQSVIGENRGPGGKSSSVFQASFKPFVQITYNGLVFVNKDRENIREVNSETFSLHHPFSLLIIAIFMD